MNDRDVRQIYADLDAMDASRVAAHFSQHGSFRFCNLPPVIGRSAIEGFLSAFFNAISSIRHDVERWDETNAGTVMVELRCTMVRPDGLKVEAPAAVIFEKTDQGISDYRVYGDFSAL